MERPENKLIGQFKRSALWSLALTVPLFFLGSYLFNPHGSIESAALRIFGLALIYPSAVIQEIGLAYSLGPTAALISVVVLQYIWTFLAAFSIRYISQYIGTKRDVNV